MKDTVCNCGAAKDRRSKVCKTCHNRRIAVLGYRAMRDKYGEKWAVKHMQKSSLNKPSDLERLVMTALNSMGITYQREYWLQTRAKGRKAKVYLIDFVINVGGRYVAIEVNGNYAHQRHGRRDLRKIRYIKRRGFSVLILTDSDIKATKAAGRAAKAASLAASIKAFMAIFEADPAPEIMVYPDPEPVPGYEYSDIPY